MAHAKAFRSRRAMVSRSRVTSPGVEKYFTVTVTELQKRGCRDRDATLLSLHNCPRAPFYGHARLLARHPIVVPFYGIALANPSVRSG